MYGCWWPVIVSFVACIFHSWNVYLYFGIHYRSLSMMHHSPSIVIWAMLQGKAMFNIEVCKTCQMPFWPSKKIFFWAFHKNVLYKVSTSHSESHKIASPKIACHKIQWLQFANRNIGGLQSWHSSKHFQIPINSYYFDFATSTRPWLQLWLSKHNYMWTWILQIELGEEWLRKSIETWNIGCIDASVIMRSSDGKYGLG
jgi:hypothetical protein